MKKLLFLALLAIGSTGCFKNYFKVTMTPGWNYELLKTYQRNNMSFIIHYNDQTVKMIDPVISEKDLRGKAGNYTPLRAGYQNPNPFDRTHVYKMKHKKALFSEAHIFVTTNYNSEPDLVIDSSRLLDSRIYVANKGASTGSHVLGVLGGLLILTAGAAAIACNCPQIYIKTDSTHYQFVAGMYSGAIMKTLERTDYLPLPGSLVQGDTVRLKITGMPGETQYMNHLGIKEVTHPEGTELVTSQKGNMFLVNKLNTPRKVNYGDNVDKSKYVWFRDGKNYEFQQADTGNKLSVLDLEYTKGKGARKALLVARLKNSDWGGYVYHQFIGLYGAAYPKWIAQQEKNNTSGSDWQKNQGLMMKVEIRTKHGWKLVDYFSATGNTASRDLAMEVPLDDIEGDRINIRMESAYRFWDVDQVGLTYTYMLADHIKDLGPISIRKNQKDQRDILAATDQNYVVLDDKEELNIEFAAAKPAPNTIRSYILVAGGYYHQKAMNNDPPQTDQLKAFLNPGAFHNYSLSKYNQLAISH